MNLPLSFVDSEGDSVQCEDTGPVARQGLSQGKIFRTHESYTGAWYAFFSSLTSLAEFGTVFVALLSK
jgi:hypothetical protein